MKKRLIGLETEYAIRNSTPSGKYKDNRLIYEYIIRAFKDFIHTAESSTFLKWNQIFAENGSAFCYESLPHYIESGLLEAATPECESPFQLLKYQRSIDYLIHHSLKKINQNNKNLYSIDKISLVKNCRDASGNIYGAQENYYVPAGNFLEIFIHRTFLFFYIPLLGLYLLAIFIFSFFILLINSVFITGFYILSYIVSFFLFKKSKIKLLTIDELNEPPEKITFLILFKRIVTIILTFTEVIFSFPIIIPYILIIKYVLFKKFKKHLLSFLITRIIITGSGGIDKNGNFYISEKATEIKRITRSTNFPTDRCIFDSGNLMKLSYLAVLSFLQLRFNYIKQLFSKNQRMQIGLSDSCMCEEAELLKIGMTNLILDMIEDDFIKESPEIINPIQTLNKYNYYPLIFFNFKVKFQKIVEEKNALEIQRWYLDKAKEYLRSRTIIDPEYNQLIKIWEEILNGLERNPASLFGKIDWITKKILIDQAIAKEENLQYEFSNSFDVNQDNKKLYKKYYNIIKIIDIKYHDLYDGYYIKLKENGLTTSFFGENEIMESLKKPPFTEKGFAHIRGSLIKKNIYGFENLRISWDHAKVGNGAISKVIDFEKYKREKDKHI